jgi:hypothetical protein
LLGLFFLHVRLPIPVNFILPLILKPKFFSAPGSFLFKKANLGKILWHKKVWIDIERENLQNRAQDLRCVRRQIPSFHHVRHFWSWLHWLCSNTPHRNHIGWSMEHDHLALPLVAYLVARMIHYEDLLARWLSLSLSLPLTMVLHQPLLVSVCVCVSRWVREVDWSEGTWPPWCYLWIPTKRSNDGRSQRNWSKLNNELCIQWFAHNIIVLRTILQMRSQERLNKWIK